MARFVALFFILQLVLIIPGNADAAPFLSIGDYELGVGETVTIDILISGIEDTLFNAFSFSVGFDSAGLMASNVLAGESVPSTASFFFQGQADNDIGEVKLFYSPFMPDPPLIADDGVLVSFDVMGLALGSYQLSLLDLAFSDVITPVEIESMDGSVNVVPIPPALLLFGSGIIGMLGLRRKFNK